MTNIEQEKKGLLLHPAREAASDAYDAARVAWLKASNGTDAQAFDAADKALNAARAKLCDMEAAHPTPAENRRRNQATKLSDGQLFQ